MGSITDSSNDDVRKELRRNTVSIYDKQQLLDLSKITLQGLLASGCDVSYDTAHQAFRMAKLMMEVKEQYVK
jgi:hypothetical protein